jgi:DNA polymerase (family 10)
MKLDNAQILHFLNLYAKLAELHDLNPFRYKAFASAAFNLKKIKTSFFELSDQELLDIPSVGKGVIEAIREIQDSGSFTSLNELKAMTPMGIIEMLQIKGLGPKKVNLIWKNLEIETTGDLLDACRQNRLVEIKGFGLKTQLEIVQNIEFQLSSQGKWHFARLWALSKQFISTLQLSFPDGRIEETGAIRRRSLIIEEIEILADLESEELIEFMETHYPDYQEIDGEIRLLLNDLYPVKVYTVNSSNFDREWFETTGSVAHLKALSYQRSEPFESEMQYYQSKGLRYIPPEQREGFNELDTEYPSAGFVEYSDLKGVLHNHTTYSDGLHSLAEMAEHAKNLNFQYLGICDHSQSASYAGGLSSEDLLRQIHEIDQLNEKWKPFRIFKGIESDILHDGSLDYHEDVLKLLDFVVASIHSGLSMDQNKAHSRLIRAIENPYTTILGHPTGRLLLMREGYPIDHRYIIDACAANEVAIELNAHPYRLDMDWKWIQYAQNKGVFISINPDAHSKESYEDMIYGTFAARKGGLLKSHTLNSLSLQEFQRHLDKKKHKLS